MRATWAIDARNSATATNLRAGAALTGAIDNADVDANLVPDGEDSGMPNLQARIGYNSPRALVGVWGHFARIETDVAFAGARKFDGHSFGGDADIRFTPKVSLRGEIWTGSMLGDIRGGAGKTFNIATG